MNYMLESQRITNTHYPLVMIWKMGKTVVQSDSLAELLLYPGLVKRVLYRRYRLPYGDAPMRWSFTVYWEAGEWSSVCVPELAVPRLLRAFAQNKWPMPELI